MVRPSAHRCCSPVIGCRARYTSVTRRANPAGAANKGAIPRMIDRADVPARRAGSSSPNMVPKLWLMFVTVPCSSVMSTPGMGEAIRQFRRSVWSASAARPHRAVGPARAQHEHPHLPGALSRVAGRRVSPDVLVDPRPLPLREEEVRQLPAQHIVAPVAGELLV